MMRRNNSRSSMLTTVLFLLLFVTLVFSSFSIQKADATADDPTEDLTAAASATDKDDWSELNECSRSCGVGVAFRTKKCSSSAASCVVERSYVICNLEECPDGDDDLRQEQCSQFDDVMFDGKLYNWKPYLDVANKCQLFCSAEGSDGERMYRRFAENVTDGTRCDRRGQNSVCIASQCLPVGCDGAIGPNAKRLDACLRCVSDDEKSKDNKAGGRCVTVHSFIDTEHVTEMGYSDLLLIPAGATSISIHKDGGSDDYFAVRGLADEIYFLHGDYDTSVIESPLLIAEAVFEYHRDHLTGVEVLSAVGPIGEDISIELLKEYPGETATISYDYSYVSSPDEPDDGSQYHWSTTVWGHCNTSCGEVGTSHRGVSCVDVTTGLAVGLQYCDSKLKPTSEHRCIQNPCTGSWKTGEWEKCSATCGAGNQFRPIMCEKMDDDGNWEIVDSDQCDVKSWPSSTQACHSTEECHNWETGSWSRCNSVCGAGKQTRQVLCRARHDVPEALSDVLPDHWCDGTTKPENMQKCDAGPCHGAEWMVTDWSGCHCQSEETRSVMCITKDGKVLADNFCDSARKPEASRVCPTAESNSCQSSTSRWFVSEWSKCSVKCGVGSQHRSVFCGEMHGDDLVLLTPGECDAAKRPTHEQPCQAARCMGLWFAAPFGKCLAACGGGRRQRELLCFVGDKAAAASECDSNLRPDAMGDCNLQPCDEDNLLAAGAQKCQDAMYGCCPDGLTAAEGPNSFGCASSDPIPTGLCVETEFGCCLDGVTPAEGPFNHGCHIPTCKETHYGCCSDGQTPAGGVHGEGCPQELNCHETAFGCCSDEKTIANGPDGEGCPPAKEMPIDTELESAVTSIPLGEKIVVTDSEVEESIVTPVPPVEHESSPEVKEEGPESEVVDVKKESEKITEDDEMNEVYVEVGGCLGTQYGCCNDQHTPRQGPNAEGCPDELPEDGSGEVAEETQLCEQSVFGCCPDRVSYARGLEGEGCAPIAPACASSMYGCCPDGHTSASGPDNKGCQLTEVEEETIVPIVDEGLLSPDDALCEISDYGCCPDGFTAATGPNNAGCDLSGSDLSPAVCSQSINGCCPDGVTPAEGMDFEGCPCDQTVFGCCPDGVTSATGPGRDGCDDELPVIPEHGGHDGCDTTSHGCCIDGVTPASGPNFAGCLEEGSYVETCADTTFGCCPDGVNPATGLDGAGCPYRSQISADCSLPKEPGLCTNYSIQWYYDTAYGDCTRFWYGGCDGNPNRFETRERCRDRCVSPVGIDRCYLPRSVGRCRGAAYKYFYNHESQKCEEFVYGGCLGNDNRFDTVDECQMACVEPHKPDVCAQPVKSGPCKGRFSRWYFDKEKDSCMQFTYGGCKGNDNRFNSADECQQRCIASAVQVCTMEKDPGPCEVEFYRWFFNAKSGVCEEFVYGGCLGNGNRFVSKLECETKCDKLLVKKPVDKCIFPRESGNCESYYEKWYFDQSDGYCKQFVYSGCGGNDNRFDSEPACRDECDANPPIDVCLLPVEIAPCDAASKYYFDGLTGQCVQFAEGGCGRNANNFASLEFCRKKCAAHLAVSSVSDPIGRCLLPRDPGPCLSSMIRWHYSTLEGRCVRFEYGGCGGNRNRFLTEDACNTECRGLITTPAVAVETTTTAEEAVFITDEPTQPIAPRLEASTTLSPVHRDEETLPPTAATDGDAAPTNGGICRLPFSPGQCSAYIHQWYFDHSTQTCKQFLYGGCGGNENRFEKKEDCERKCSDTNVCMLPSSTGECLAYIPMWYYDKATDRCMQFIYGGCGGNENRFDVKEACETRCRLRKANVTGLAVCSQRAEVGPCRAAIPKWYYDQEQGSCQQFTFGGCEGNQNQFDTKEECQQTCPVTEICQLPAETGPCRASKPRFYFDIASRSCRQFTYGGCNGNANRFLTIENCQAICEHPGTDDDDTVAMTVKPSGERATDLPPTVYTYTKYRVKTTTTTEPTETEIEEPSEPETNVCWLPSDQGPCDAYIPAFFYDPLAERCAEFIWGGCGGNANRFMSLDDCEQRCVHTESETFAPVGPEVEETTPPTADTDDTEPETHEDADATVTDICQLPSDAGDYCSGWELFWYFDKDLGYCRQFYYGGCEGNGNRFVTEEDCASACRTSEEEETTTIEPVVVTEPVVPAETITVDSPNNGVGKPPADDSIDVYELYDTDGVKATVDICQLPSDAGDYCSGWELFWYFDKDLGYCRQFYYGGCAGNGNRFRTEEDCVEVCKIGQNVPEHVTTTPQAADVGEEDVEGMVETVESETSIQEVPPTAAWLPDNEYEGLCDLPKMVGPCFDDSLRYYWSAEDSECRPFTYGGCDGNANNFLSTDDCYNRCAPTQAERREFRPSDCMEPADPGPCDQLEQRWFFDPEMGECLSFYYGGCSGNRNNFIDYDDCFAYCSEVTAVIEATPAPETPEAVVIPEVPEEPVAPARRCDTDIEHCNLVCPHGFEYDSYDCPQCRCADPCREHECPENTECFAVNVTCIRAPCLMQPVCKPTTVKPGLCPRSDHPLLTSAGCRSDCVVDSDCSGPAKCCSSSGCGGKICFQPEIFANCSITVFGCCNDGITPAGGWNLHGCPEEAPTITNTEGVINAVLGATVSIRCEARAAPKAQIMWYKDSMPIYHGYLEEDGRFTTTSDGTLHITDVELSDATEYTCRAINSLGTATQTFTLTVNVPAEIEGGSQLEHLDAHVGESVELVCAVTGIPQPTVRWLKGNEIISPDSEHYVLTERALEIVSAEPDDSGDYTCEVQNGFGLAQRKLFIVEVMDVLSVEVRIVNDTTRFNEGQTALILCESKSSGNVELSWTKNGTALPADDRYHATREGQLSITDVAQSDAGSFTCTATRGHDTAEASVALRVKGSSIPENCTDKPWYANCDLIIQANLCRHPYFSIFCCRTCYNAGLLP